MCSSDLNVFNHRKLGTGLGLAIVKEILEKHKLNFGAYKDEDKIIFWFEGEEE